MTSRKAEIQAIFEPQKAGIIRIFIQANPPDGEQVFYKECTCVTQEALNIACQSEEEAEEIYQFFIK